MKKKIQIGLVLIGLANACQSSKVDRITYHDTSDTSSLYFAPTMEQELPTGKNAVYAVSFPLAWQQVRQELKISGKINTASSDLRMLDDSKNVNDALNDDDYEREIEWDGRTLRVNTKQEVNLTFVPAYEDLPGGITFDRIDVDAFGTSGFQNIAHRNLLDITAYRDNDRFILRLLPMEQEHEIYLFKADSVYSTFQQMYADMREFCRHAELVKHAGGQQSWIYQLTDIDVVRIPKINFDQRHRFRQFLNALFFVKRKEYNISDATQEISFGLNQHGVSMKSEAEIIVNDGAYPTEDPPLPKQLIFDKPFYIVMKKNDMENPYFALYVKDTTLMEKGKTKGKTTP